MYGHENIKMCKEILTGNLPLQQSKHCTQKMHSDVNPQKVGGTQ